MVFDSFADEMKFMTVDAASRRLGQIADDLAAKQKELELRLASVEDRLDRAEAQIADCCGHAPLHREDLHSPSAPVSNPSSNNP